MSKRTLSIFFACAAVNLCGPVQSNAQQSYAPKIKALVQPYLDAERVVGISVGVIERGNTETAHFGSTGPGGGRPNDDTLYEIGSVTKVFTSLLVADASVRQTIRLDQPAGDLLPNEVAMPSWNNRPIRFSDLVTHRSGLPSVVLKPPFEDLEDPYGKFTSKQAYEFLSEYKLTRPPGSQYEYSNFGMALAGHLICRQAGKSYDELLQERITGPLGMTATTVEVPEKLKQRLATPHTLSCRPTKPWTFADLAGAGGIRSSLADMLTFAQANITPPEGKIGEAIELAWKKAKYSGAEEQDVCLGWEITGNGFARKHSGRTGGFSSCLLVGRPKATAVVLLTNTAQGNELDELAVDLMQTLRGVDIKPRKIAKRIILPPELLQRYGGKYELLPGIETIVSVDGNDLQMRLPGQPNQKLYPKSETVWIFHGVPASVTFDLDESKNCTSLTLEQNGMRHTAKRVD